MMNDNFSLILKGMAMGIAEVIPGVSGGTIAFITGIYEKLINTITAFGPKAINAYKKDGLSGLWESINGTFLTFLLGGMAIGLLTGVFGISYLLDQYPEPLWGFFFGLIIASAIYIGKQIKNWNSQKIVALILGAVIAYGITLISPAEGSTNPLYIFLAGMIAISALILPGISGSFILLLMGMYTIIISTGKSFIQNQDSSSLILLGIFGSGCLVGLLGFSRILKWLFSKYKDLSFAVLTGFLIGALNKIWPWRNVTEILEKESGQRLVVEDASNFKNIDPETIKILSEVNVFPAEYLISTPKTLATISCLLIGFLLVLGLERFQSQK